MKRIIKNLICLLMLCMMLAGLSGVASAQDTISVILDGKKLTFEDQNPLILEDRTLVPFRGILEAMGVTVSWEGSTRTVTAVRDDITVQLTIDDPVMYKNGEAITLDVPAQIVGSRTMVPARAVSESFGADVSWNPTLRNVVISTDEVLNKALKDLFSVKKMAWSGQVDFTYNGVPVAATSIIALDYEAQLEVSGFTIDIADNKTSSTIVTGKEKTYVDTDGKVTEEATPADWEPSMIFEPGTAFAFKTEEAGERLYQLVHGSSEDIKLEIVVDAGTAQVKKVNIPKKELGIFLNLPTATYTEDLEGELVFGSDEALKLWKQYNK